MEANDLYGTIAHTLDELAMVSPPAFQRFVNETFMDYLDKFVTAYIDDLLIYSTNQLEHEHHVKLVLEQLRQA